VRRPAYSYIQYSDQIFQAFVVSMMASCLDLTPMSPVLGLAQPAFASDELEIYFNVTPPSGVLRSWRSYTHHPDLYRPDILIMDGEGRVAIGDAKYRNEGGGPSESSRKEILAYMAAYGLDIVTIFYPALADQSLVVTEVGHGGKTILEVPIRPGGELEEFLVASLPSVLGRVQTPPWRD
jgi:hypothetical protein